MEKKVKVYQASTSELFGKVQETPQSELTPFYPRSPYGVAKMYAYWITKNYREAYGIFACNGILFNHESPMRGETFVSRKITRAVTRIYVGLQNQLLIGNLDAKRDWGHAKDYVKSMWMMLQQDKADDFIIASGQNFSVREFIIKSFKLVGIDVDFKGSGVNETGVITKIINQSDDLKVGQTIVKVDPVYFRPSEVDTLLGDSNKARTKLKWKPEYDFDSLVQEMVQSDLILANKEKIINEY